MIGGGLGSNGFDGFCDDGSLSDAVLRDCELDDGIGWSVYLTPRGGGKVAQASHRACGVQRQSSYLAIVHKTRCL